MQSGGCLLFICRSVDARRLLGHWLVTITFFCESLLKALVYALLGILNQNQLAICCRISLDTDLHETL